MLIMKQNLFSQVKKISGMTDLKFFKGGTYSRLERGTSQNAFWPKVASAAVRSKAVAFLLLIYCFMYMYLPLYVGVLCFGFVMHYLVSFLFLQSS